MGRLKTTNTPELQALLTPKTPQNPVTLAVEQALMHGRDWSASVAEQIAVRLAGLITIDVIHAGQRLLEKDISDVLEVSRAPVREALRILERERLIEFRARRGAIVTEPNAQDLKDIYVVREALFAILLRELMEERVEALDALFEAFMPKLSKAVEDSAVDAYISATFLANMAMADLSRNRLVGDLLNSIALRTLRYVRLGLAANPGSLENSIKTWRALQRSVARRDIDVVLQTARKRIESSRDAAIRTLSSGAPKSKGAASRPSAAPAKAA
ncbi:GntR family transcriptional regulator [Cupriavidus necator]|uniref:GntR family transcriptional regulator n=1 Tax=Cupriavidus necator TaxID=106590 RepID=UPI0005B35615|nr:GntR family transcriptional regulator [Cupriavidus necator]